MSTTFETTSRFFSKAGDFIAVGSPYWCTFILALIAALLLTPPVRGLCKRMGMIDMPDARRINKTPVPRGGGIAVFISVAIALIVSPFIVNFLKGKCEIPEIPVITDFPFIGLCLAIAALGVIDDRFNLSPRTKLLGQIAVAIGAFVFTNARISNILLPLFPDGIPYFLDMALTIFWITAIINAFNLIDGIDGLASGMGLIAATGMAGTLIFRGHAGLCIPYLALAGACIGFLRYNFNPASVFLGDCGSMFIGFFLSVGALKTSSADSLFCSLGVPLLTMGVPLFDTSLAIIRRWVRSLIRKESGDTKAGGAKIMNADTDHLHHRILRASSSQKTAALTLYLIALALVAVGIGGLLLKSKSAALFIVAFIVAVFVAVKEMERVELWDLTMLLSRVDNNKTHRRARLFSLISTPLYILLDTISLICVWAFAMWLTDNNLGIDSFLHILPLFICPAFVILALGGIYTIAWSRMQVNDLIRLALTMFLSSAAAVVLCIATGSEVKNPMAFATLFGSLGFLPIAASRVAKDCAREFFYRLGNLNIAGRKDSERIIAYGAGIRFRAFRRELVRATSLAINKRIIVGIIDDDRTLRNKVVAGIPVLGTLKDTGDAIIKTKAQAIVITALLNPKRRELALKYFRTLNVRIYEWACTETVLK